MKVTTKLFICLIICITSSCNLNIQEKNLSSKLEQQSKHLFILSGQSNMHRLNLKESFIPAIDSEFTKGNSIFVKDATGGRSIKRWYRNWEAPTGEQQNIQVDLYDSLMAKVNPVINNEKIKTVTFIWMQGERDANSGYGKVYEKSLIGLYKQLSNDLERTDINFVIGRLSDFDMSNERYIHWTMIRDIQVKVAASNPHFDWINTDDLNDGVNSEGQQIQNDLHMSVLGYEIMGKRFAEKSIGLINKTNSF
tara:strand:- start:2916 stop:3668 length:753 start_codon:yes stop_codon:yes gene_type:complete